VVCCSCLIQPARLKSGDHRNNRNNRNNRHNSNNNTLYIKITIFATLLSVFNVEMRLGCFGGQLLTFSTILEKRQLGSLVELEHGGIFKVIKPCKYGVRSLLDPFRQLRLAELVWTKKILHQIACTEDELSSKEILKLVRDPILQFTKIGLSRTAQSGRLLWPRGTWYNMYGSPLFNLGGG